MIVYQTGKFGIYLGAVEADESPLEPGKFLIPAGCVEMAPPEVPEGKVAVWVGQHWSIRNAPEPQNETGEETPPLTDAEKLVKERSKMELSFAQFIVGLTENGWITDAEAEDWLSAIALPVVVENAIASLPTTGQGNANPRLRARARALRPSSIQRNNELLAMMAQIKGATGEQLDDLFRNYSQI